MAQGYRSPDLPRYSRVVIGWATGRPPGALAADVAGWGDDAWEAARWAIQVHGIGPLLHYMMAGTPEAAVLHPRLRDYLAIQYRRSAERVALLLGELAELLAACHDAGIVVAPLKGSLLATGYYPEPGLRPMNDLDLLVRPADEQRLLGLLERLGYQPIARSWKHLMLARPAGRGPVVDWDGEHPDNPRSLDMHTQLYEQFWGLSYDLTDATWAASAPGMLLGVETQLLRPAALLHHLAVHASSDTIARRIRLLHLHDIAVVARDVDESGWRQILGWARDQREQRLLYPALAFTQRYYPVVPEHVLRELRAALPRALLDYLDTSDLDHFTYCNTAPTVIRERLRWFRPGREQLLALRHMLLPNAGEIATWYPALARPALRPLAYARYSADLIGWGVRRALGRPRRTLARDYDVGRVARGGTEEKGNRHG